MNVALIDVDSLRPNLALMKLAAYYKALGHTVDFFMPIMAGFYDLILASKIFTGTPGIGGLPIPEDKLIKGGTGFDLGLTLDEAIEHAGPDYSLYPGLDYSMGFLTRGCPRKCNFCFVPEKEGGIRAHAEFQEFVHPAHDKVLLLDNNILASEHGIVQLEALGKARIAVDCNQGLDARLIDDAVAKMLKKLWWWKPIRLACDHKSQMAAVQKAVMHLRYNNVRPTNFECYVLVTDDIPDALERVKFLRGIHVQPFAQAFRSLDGADPTRAQKQFCRWVNSRAAIGSSTWEEYQMTQNARGLI